MLKKMYSACAAAIMIVFTAVPAVFSAPVDVNIVHTADMEGNILKNEDNGTIGYGNVLSVKEGIGEAVVADAGNFLCDTVQSSLGINSRIIYAMNKVGYDFVTLGNKELKYSKAELDSLFSVAEFDIISSNITVNGEYVFEQTVTDTINGVKTGIFAVTDGSDTADFKLTDPEEEAQKCTKRLKAGGSKIIIALINTKDPEFSKKIARQNPDITVIIEGGTGNFASGGTPEGRTLIVNTGFRGNAVGVSAVTVNGGQLQSFRTSNYTLKNINEVYPDTNDLEEEMKKAQTEIDSLNNEALGYLEEALSYNETDIRTKSTPLGNFAADALRKYAETDFAVVRGSEIRGGLSEKITGSQIFGLFSHNGDMEIRKITGSNFLKAMEMCVNKIQTDETGEINYENSVSDNFLQISGFRMEYNPEYETGKRIIRIVTDDGKEINWTNGSREYTVAGFADFFSSYNEYFSSAEKTEIDGTAVEAVKKYISDNENITADKTERVKATTEKKNYMWIAWIVIGSFAIAGVLAYIVAKIVLIINNR